MNTKIIGSVLFGLLIIFVALAVMSLYRIAPFGATDHATTTPESGVACTQEAKICPDGSNVGRSGPNCEFDACPTAAAIEYHSGDTVMVTARIGQRVSALGETITPLEVTEDSRCPRDVQCIWAGTVKVRAMAHTGMGDSDIPLELAKVSSTEINTFELVNVAPAKDSTRTIGANDYVFTIKVTRR